MSKVATSFSAHSHTGSLRSPPQNSRPRLAQNGSARPLHTASTSLNGLKLKDDLLLADPDEIFAKHTVHEVKSILHRLRSDVDAKQEELRLMVGERYRDLLQASTSIISMSQSSKRVLDMVTRMKRTISTDLKAQNLPGGFSKSSDIEDAQLKILQCLAAHLKLLLDAPEHLWRLLERKRCLHAAWLFLLSRVVYRSLINEDSEEGQDWARQGINVKEQFPLVQRQWESVAQFRAQISHKATLSLREQNLESQDLCASLLALHLLDSLPLSDALDVFLKQRSRTLQILYESIKESWRENVEPSSIRAEKSGKDGIKSIWDVVRSVLGAIVGTVGGAREVFRENADGSPSMTTQVLVFTQTDSCQPSTSLPPELCLSSQTLLSSLPNSNHFLTLPADIRSYRPFIDLDSQSSSVRPETLTSKLRSWFTRATEDLHESAGSWLFHLETIKKVWEVRSSALKWISASSALLEEEDIEALYFLVDDVFRTRAQDVWKAALGKISSSFEEALRSLALAVAEEHDDSQFDISPVEFLLSAPPAPSVTQASLNVSLAQSSFQRFRLGIQRRIDGVTPIINRIMSDAESAALSLRDDLDIAFADEKNRSLEVSYVSDSEKTIDALLASVEKLLDAESDDSERSIRRLYFLGRVAQKISVSPLLGYLYCSAAFSDNCHARARHIYDSCVEKCASVVALSARDRFLRDPVLQLHAVHNSQVALPTNPSPHLINSLLSLVDSVERFGHFRDDAQRSAVVRTVLSRFSNAVVGSLRQSTRRAELQLIWDLYFLKAVCDDWGNFLSESVALLDQTIKQFYQSLPFDVGETYPDLEAQMPQSVSHSIKHVRLLLSPLVAPLDLSSSTKSQNLSALELSRQKTVSSSLGVEHETQFALNLVKPSARFGSLWVATVAAR